MCKEQISFNFKESFIWSKDHSSLIIREKVANSEKKFPDLSVDAFPTPNQEFNIPDLKLISQEKEVCYKIWNNIIIESLMSVKDTASKKEKEAYELVWFTQFRSRYPKHNDSEQIEQKYKEKIEQLRGNEGPFYHGFNSGVLAFSRMILRVCQIPEEVASIEVRHYLTFMSMNTLITQKFFVQPSTIENINSKYAQRVDEVKMSFPDKNVSDCPSNRKD